MQRCPSWSDAQTHLEVKNMNKGCARVLKGWMEQSKVVEWWDARLARAVLLCVMCSSCWAQIVLCCPAVLGRNNGIWAAAG
jgi:hypothetical protein